MQSVKKERYLFLHNLISTIAAAYFPWLSIMTSPLPKNKMTFLMAKILDQFRQMAFEFLPHDVMVSFHFQIWPWCSLKIGEKVQISHLPSRDADDNEFQLVFMEGKFALLHTYLLRYQWSRGDICSLILSLTLLKKNFQLQLLKYIKLQDEIVCYTIILLLQNFSNVTEVVNYKITLFFTKRPDRVIMNIMSQNNATHNNRG